MLGLLGGTPFLESFGQGVSSRAVKPLPGGITLNPARGPQNDPIWTFTPQKRANHLCDVLIQKYAQLQRKTT
jgi:hypothetical protein